jgi:hypothetical protein
LIPLFRNKTLALIQREKNYSFQPLSACPDDENPVGLQRFSGEAGFYSPIYSYVADLCRQHGL